MGQLASRRHALYVCRTRTGLGRAARTAYRGTSGERLHLCGRLRVSPQGLNGTLSGPTAALGEYTRSVDARCAVEGGQAIDWKFGSCAISECFRELSVRAVREVVSLGVPLVAVPLGKAATHLSAAEFHARLAAAAESGNPKPEPKPNSDPNPDPNPSPSPNPNPNPNQGAVVLDVRNVYESRIGRFEAAGAETLCPSPGPKPRP